MLFSFAIELCISSSLSHRTIRWSEERRKKTAECYFTSSIQIKTRTRCNSCRQQHGRDDKEWISQKKKRTEKKKDKRMSKTVRISFSEKERERKMNTSWDFLLFRHPLNITSIRMYTNTLRPRFTLSVWRWRRDRSNETHIDRFHVN